MRLHTGGKTYQIINAISVLKKKNRFQEGETLQGIWDYTIAMNLCLQPWKETNISLCGLYKHLQEVASTAAAIETTAHEGYLS